MHVYLIRGASQRKIHHFQINVLITQRTGMCWPCHGYGYEVMKSAVAAFNGRPPNSMGSSVSHIENNKQERFPPEWISNVCFKLLWTMEIVVVFMCANTWDVPQYHMGLNASSIESKKINSKELKFIIGKLLHSFVWLSLAFVQSLEVRELCLFLFTLTLN